MLCEAPPPPLPPLGLKRRWGGRGAKGLGGVTGGDVGKPYLSLYHPNLSPQFLSHRPAFPSLFVASHVNVNVPYRVEVTFGLAADKLSFQSLSLTAFPIGRMKAL